MERILIRLGHSHLQLQKLDLNLRFSSKSRFSSLVIAINYIATIWELVRLFALWRPGVWINWENKLDVPYPIIKAHVKTSMGRISATFQACVVWSTVVAHSPIRFIRLSVWVKTSWYLNRDWNHYISCVWTSLLSPPLQKAILRARLYLNWELLCVELFTLFTSVQSQFLSTFGLKPALGTLQGFQFHCLKP